MLAHPVRYLLPYVPFAMATSTYARCFPPFPFIVLCASVGGKCAPDAHWRRVRLWPAMRPRLCVWLWFLFFGAAWRRRVPAVTFIPWAWQPTAM